MPDEPPHRGLRFVGSIWLSALAMGAAAIAGCGDASPPPSVEAVATPPAVEQATTTAVNPAESTPTPAPTPTETPARPTPVDLEAPVVPAVIGLNPWRARAVLEEVGVVIPIARQRWDAFDAPVVVNVLPAEGTPFEPRIGGALIVGEATDLLPGEVVQATVLRDWVVPPEVGRTRTVVDVELVGGRTVLGLERRVPLRTQVVEVDAMPPLGCDRRPLEEGEVVAAGTLIRFRFVYGPGVRSGVDESIDGVGVALVC